MLICETHHGFVCANAGVDASNVPGDGHGRAAAARSRRVGATLRARMRELTGRAPAVVITDSFGRAWRHGQFDVAIGCAGLAPLEDWRGRTDAIGRELHGDLDRGRRRAGGGRRPRPREGRLAARSCSIRGAERHVSAEDGPGAAALIRPEAEDLFR